MTAKEFFDQEYANIFRFHRAGAGGLAVAAELTQLVDTTLTRLWEQLPDMSRHRCTVVALGGYGRCEMAPHSDVDVMVLFADERSRSEGSDTAQQFLHSLWNLGFDVGHSVRTIDDCLKLYQTDVDVWASVLESRYVCGDSGIMDRYTSAFLSAVEHRSDRSFITSVLSGVDERHDKYEHSVKLLEPNVKNCAGGIRDIHSLVWLYRSTDRKYFTSTPFRSNQSASVSLFQRLAEEGIITENDALDIIAAFNGILRLRNELHYTSNAPQDILEFSKQREIAAALGYRGTTPLEAVEQCMRDYFLRARSVYRMNKRLTGLFRTSGARLFWSMKRESRLDDLFVISDRQLSLRDRSAAIATPQQLLRAFYWCGFHRIDMSHPLQSEIFRCSKDPGFFRSEGDLPATEFLSILRLPSSVAHTVAQMNDSDILGALFPEWNDLVAFFQHSAYHYYTTDAHTVIALEHAEQLAERKGVLGDTYRLLPQKELLFLAILFHDIAKPHGIQGHEIAGVAIWNNIRSRWGFEDPGGTVAFLIRHHLVMEQVAFRRDINDAATVKEFASLFNTPEQLDLLFVLTYCDLSAVNKNVWSQWKETLLTELFVKTRRLLTGSADLLPEPAERMPVSEEEQHAIERISAGADTVSVHYRHDDTHSIIHVITTDAEYLLSTVCGVLSANDVSIFDAQIHTRPDGIVIDRFRVVNAASKQALSEEQEHSIAQDLRNVLLHRETLEGLFARYHRRWRRRAKPLFHPNVRIDTVFHDTNRHTIVDVYGPDMIGFLFKITQTLSRAGMRIDVAKLATRGDGIVDSFYITKGGKPISSEREKEYLREEILHTIHQLMTVQLETQ